MITKVGPDTDIKWWLELFGPGRSHSIRIPIQEMPPTDIHQLASDLAEATGKRVTVVSTTKSQTTYGVL